MDPNIPQVPQPQVPPPADPIPDHGVRFTKYLWILLGILVLTTAIGSTAYFLNRNQAKTVAQSTPAPTPSPKACKSDSDCTGNYICQLSVAACPAVVCPADKPNCAPCVQSGTCVPSSNKTSTSGILGIITIGPICPGPARLDQPCPDKPYEGTVIVMSADGSKEITRFSSSADGNFRVGLLPGTYQLTSFSPGAEIKYPILKTQVITVTNNSYTKINLTFDTGIR